jgi:hypothetical protein
MALLGSRRGQGEPFSIVVCGSTVERDQTFICGLGPGDGGLARHDVRVMRNGVNLGGEALDPNDFVSGRDALT